MDYNLDKGEHEDTWSCVDDTPDVPICSHHRQKQLSAKRVAWNVLLHVNSIGMRSEAKCFFIDETNKQNRVYVSSWP